MDLATKNALELLGADSTLDKEKKLARFMFYGDPGAGKTTLAASIALELGEKVMFVTTDSAWSVLYKYPDWLNRIHRVPFGGMSQLVAMVHARAEGLAPYAECDTLVWDTASGGLAISLRNLVKGKPLPAAFLKQQIDKDSPVWQHYGLLVNALTDTIDVLNRSDLHIIYTAHTREPGENDIAKKKFAVRPDMPEKSYLAIAKEVGLMGYMYKEKKGSERLIQFEGTLTESAKSQITGIEETTYKASDIPSLVKGWVYPND